MTTASRDIHTLGLSPDVPPTVAMAFAPLASEQAAEQWTAKLAHGHYENFSVVSLLLPQRLRQDFCNVYAFCRVADDLGDEVGDHEKSLRYLADFKEQTRACFAGQARTAVFQALSATIRRHEMPLSPFLDLVDAFEQDQRVPRYETFEQVLDYCRRSANPVGRLVLWMCGYRDARRQELSDKTCTALQLANFWQDVRRDVLELDRIYIPRDSMERFSVSEEQIREGRCDEHYRELMRFEVDRADAMFAEGEALLPLLDRSIRHQIALFGRGGRAILDAIRRRNYDTLSARPRLGKWRKVRLLLPALAGIWMARLFGGRA